MIRRIITTQLPSVFLQSILPSYLASVFIASLTMECMYEYSILAFGDMINSANKTRVDAYARALRETITEDSVVLEIGTGVGFFALLACKFGARHVYAVEPNASIQVARELAVANGYVDRITFFEGLSTRIELPQRADVIVSDIRGVLPWLADHIPSIKDARQRHLKASGTLIPGKDSVWAALVHAPQHYARRSSPWDENTYGLNLDAARQRTINTYGKGHVEAEQLLTEPKCWTMLNYYTIEEPDARGQLAWTARKCGTVHGISMWFETDLIGDVKFSNAPDQPHNPIYSQSFYPLERPVELQTDDQIALKVHAKRTSENLYEWFWETTVQSEDGKPKAHFKQSTFAGRVWSPDDLRQQSPTFVPSLAEDAEIDRAALDLIDGRRTQQAIADKLKSRFPNRFATTQEALSRITKLMRRYR